MHILAFAETIQLFPDGTIFVHVALILLMIWILNRTLYRPINRVLEMREKNKGGHSSEAVTILDDAGKKEAKYKREMLDARSKGYELIEKEHQKANASHDEKLAVAKVATAEKFNTGKAELEKQKATAHAAIGSEAEKMAEKIAANILKA